MTSHHSILLNMQANTITVGLQLSMFLNPVSTCKNTEFLSTNIWIFIKTTMDWIFLCVFFHTTCCYYLFIYFQFEKCMNQFSLQSVSHNYALWHNCQHVCVCVCATVWVCGRARVCVCVCLQFVRLSSVFGKK